MIGLEYICELYNKKFITLANDLGISRQVVNGWIKGRRPITKKYLPVLVDMFNIPEKYFQMELDKKDEVTIQQLKLKNELITYDYEYKEFNEDISGVNENINYSTNKEGKKIIGLEYILKIYNKTQQKLADELGIKRQNIDAWIRDIRPIPKKYYEQLGEIFVGIDSKYFSKKLSDYEMIKLLDFINSTKNKTDNEEMNTITNLEVKYLNNFNDRIECISLILNHKSQINNSIKTIIDIIGDKGYIISTKCYSIDNRRDNND